MDLGLYLTLRNAAYTCGSNFPKSSANRSSLSSRTQSAVPSFFGGSFPHIPMIFLQSIRQMVTQERCLLSGLERPPSSGFFPRLLPASDLVKFFVRAHE